MTQRADRLAHEDRISPDIAATKTSWFAGEPKSPFQPDALYPRRGLHLGAGEEIEGGPHGDRHYRQ